MKKQKARHTHKHANLHSRKSQGFLKRYRFAIVGILSFAVIIFGGFSLSHSPKVLGASTSDIAYLWSGGGGPNPKPPVCQQKPYECNGKQLCKISGDCRRTCVTVPGRCGVPSCTYTNVTACGQSGTMKKYCPSYSKFYTVSAKVPGESGCSVQCSGKLEDAKCGLPAINNFSNNTPDIVFTKITCSQNASRYNFSVNGEITQDGDLKKPLSTDGAFYLAAFNAPNPTSSDSNDTVGERSICKQTGNRCAPLAYFDVSLSVSKSKVTKKNILVLYAASFNASYGGVKHSSNFAFFDLSKCR